MLKRLLDVTLPALRNRLRARLPMPFAVLDLASEADLVDRAAAVALFCMFAAVPAMFVALSVIGFLVDEVALAGHLAGESVPGMQTNTLARVEIWVHNALPGVTWNPAEFAQTLVAHKTAHGFFGTILAISLALTVLSRIDHAIRTLFHLPERSTLKAAGIFSLLVVIAAFAGILVTVFGPMLEWGARLAGRSVTALSLGHLDGWASLVAVSQTFPVAAVFYALVRWSAGQGVARKRLLATSMGFGLLWFIGQRLFSLYVSKVVQMDAVYGALTGVVALMMWLFYANIAFLAAVAMLATWHARALRVAEQDVTG